MEAIESIPQPLQVFGLPQTLVYGTGVFKPGEEPETSEKAKGAVSRRVAAIDAIGCSPRPTRAVPCGTSLPAGHLKHYNELVRSLQPLIRGATRRREARINQYAEQASSGRGDVPAAPGCR